MSGSGAAKGGVQAPPSNAEEQRRSNAERFSRAISSEHDSATKANISSSRTDFRQAKQLFQDGRIEDALRMYTQVQEALDCSDSYWAICHNQMGLCYSKLGDDDSAIGSYTAAINTGAHKDLHIWHMNRGVKLKAAGQIVRAKADFERVVQLRENSTQAQKVRRL
jgi:tetratricopeptide (TPR) repeat protein